MFSIAFLRGDKLNRMREICTPELDEDQVLARLSLISKIAVEDYLFMWNSILPPSKVLDITSGCRKVDYVIVSILVLYGWFMARTSRLEIAQQFLSVF